MKANELGRGKDPSRDSPASSLGGELIGSLFRLARSEIHLASAELHGSTERVGKYVFQSALCGSLVGLSGIPILAFLIIGLGQLLGGDYLLSSFCVAVLSIAVAGIAFLVARKKFHEEKVALPRTIEALKKEGELIGGASRRIADTVKKRRSA